MKEFFNKIITVPKELNSITTILSWIEVHKSSDFPIDTNKPYFCRWKIGDEEGIWWGDMDDIFFTNFSERGKIKNSNWAEKGEPLGEMDKSAHLPIN